MKVEDDVVLFNQPVRFGTLPIRLSDRFIVGDTTPSVKNVEVWIAQNIAPTLITDFDDAAENQTIEVLGDGFTSVASNANIVPNGGSHVLTLNTIFRFTNINGVWYEGR